MENKKKKINKPRRIGIDMRMAGTGEGIGRYTEELVKHLSEIDQSNQYFLLTGKNSKFQIPNSRMTRVEVVSPYYSVAEQTKFIYELYKLNLDLIHFTSFNAPLLYQGRFVATIHDLIHHYFPGKKKSRLPHRLAYRAVMRQTVTRADKVITVSQSTKDDLVKYYKLPSDRFEVVYEGANSKFSKPVLRRGIESVKAKYNISKPYLLFVGVWRQYKNLQRLARAFDLLVSRHHHDIELVLAGKVDPFYPEIKKAVMSIKNASRIRALGFVPDKELPALYQGAAVFVLPSLMEGFGLIGVEAQMAGAPVVASDIRVLREILGDSAAYFNPLEPKQMADKITNLLNDPGRLEQVKESGKINSRRFDWQKTAEKTLKVYNTVLS